MKSIVLWTWNIWNRIEKNFWLEQKSISAILETTNKVDNILDLDNLQSLSNYIISELNNWKNIIWTGYFSEELRYILNEIYLKIPEKTANFLLFWTNWFDVNPWLKFSQIVLNSTIKKEQLSELSQSPWFFWVSIFYSPNREIFSWFVNDLRNKWLIIENVETEDQILKETYLKSSLNVILNTAWVLFCKNLIDSIKELNKLYSNYYWLDWLIWEIALILNSKRNWIIKNEELLSFINNALEKVPNVYASSVYLYWDIEKWEKKKVSNWDVYNLLNFLINNAKDKLLSDKIPILLDLNKKILEF